MQNANFNAANTRNLANVSETSPYFRLTNHLMKRHYMIHFIVKNNGSNWLTYWPQHYLLGHEQEVHLSWALCSKTSGWPSSGYVLPKGWGIYQLGGACATSSSILGTLKFLTCVALIPFSRHDWAFFPGFTLLRADGIAGMCSLR